jgi:hypothetical protein
MSLLNTCIVFLVCKFLFPAVSTVYEPLTNRVVLLCTLLQDILHPSHHLLNVLLQIANKLGLSNQKKHFHVVITREFSSIANSQSECPLCRCPETDPLLLCSSYRLAHVL